MINILHAIDTPGPGGAETIFVNLINGLNKMKFKSYVAIPSRGWIYGKLSENNFELFCIDTKGSFNFKYLIMLIKIIKKHRIEIIQSHLLGSNVYCCLAGILCSVPVVCVFHGFVDAGNNNWLMWLKARLINIKSKKIVFVSNKLRDNFIKRYKFDYRKSVTIYNGVDTKIYKQKRDNILRKELGFKKKHILIGSVGNIRPAKGYNFLMLAARIVIDKNPNCRFIVAGEGSGILYENLLKLRQKIKLEKEFIFLGFIDDVQRMFNSIDIFVLPSISEGFSLAAIEAMASKILVIVTKCGGPEEFIIHGENGLIAIDNNQKRFANTILKVANDNKIKEKIINNAKQTVEEKFALSKMIKGYEIIYQNIMRN